MKKIREENRKRYVADFETLQLTDEQIKEGAHTYVWAYSIYDCSTDTIRRTASSIGDFMAETQNLPDGATIYFHNEKFDASFILCELLRREFVQVNKKPYELKDGEFIVMCTGLGIFYALIICQNNKLLYIYDSLKKLPFKVEEIAKKLGMDVQKGSIDYYKHREEGAELSAEDKDYVERDVIIVGRALQKIFFDNGFYGMTIGADCMKFYKSLTKQFNAYFPKLDAKEDEFVRKTLTGGKTYIEPKYRGVLIEEQGISVDVNGLYSAMMHSKSGNIYPVGKGEYFKGQYEPDEKKPLYFQHIRCAFVIRDGFTPTIQLKGNMLFKQTEYITTTHGEIVDLYLTSIDLEVFLKHYKAYMYDEEDESIEYVDGYKYQAASGLFDRYIDHWAAKKEEASKNGDPFLRLISKLFLNNLFGKFGANPNSSRLVFSINDAKLCRKSEKDQRQAIYVPVASFVTSYARKFLNESIQKNKGRFIYCDTDSMKLLGTQAPEGLVIDDTALGAWKIEHAFTKAKFLRQKCYAEEYNNTWHFKCAGLPNADNVLTIGSFYEGSVIQDAKLITKQVSGGVVLLPTSFKISNH